MTMRRISVLLVAVVLTMMLSVGSALAHKSGNHKVCHRGHTISGLTHKQQQRHLNRHDNDYKGKCHNRGGVNIAKVTAAPFR
jgi:hypothetical protein